jgi:hypothetical protein
MRDPDPIAEVITWIVVGCILAIIVAGTTVLIRWMI